MQRAVIYIARPWINRSIEKHLGGSYSADAIGQLIWNGWWSYNQLRKDVSRESTAGARIMVELAVVSEAFYLELLKHENSKENAIDQFNLIAWDIYERMGRLAWWITGFGSKNEFDHLRKSIMAFRSFPFGSPSYLWKDLPAEKGTVAFNCERCPVANYFKEKDLADFGFSTWCKYDYRMAELWGGKLELTNTIAGGAEVCDFKWTAKQLHLI